MTDLSAMARPRGTSRAAALIWLALAFVACMSVTILNGRPLFYYDTRGYIDQGTTGLTQLHLIPRPMAQTTAPVTLQREAGDVTAPVGTNNTVDGSRSASYALIVRCLPI